MNSHKGDPGLLPGDFRGGLSCTGEEFSPIYSVFLCFLSIMKWNYLYRFFICTKFPQDARLITVTCFGIHEENCNKNSQRLYSWDCMRQNTRTKLQIYGAWNTLPFEPTIYYNQFRADISWRTLPSPPTANRRRFRKPRKVMSLQTKPVDENKFSFLVCYQSLFVPSSHITLIL